MSLNKITLPLTKMTCVNCAMNIERSVKKLKGVKEATVNFASEQAIINFDPEQLKISEVVEKIRGSGYGVPVTKIELPITGMTCANCAMNIERVLKRKVAGITDASVNFATERAIVEYVPTVVSLDGIIAAIKKAGYGTVAPDDIMDAQDAEQAARNAEIKTKPGSLLSAYYLPYPFFSSVWGGISTLSACGVIIPW